jgi:7-carboxy-7-deazaguanine synthase
MTLQEVMDKVRSFGCQLVEVTGGEPLAQKECFQLLRQLSDEGFEVLLETGGYVSTQDVDPRVKVILDIKCPGSGEATRNHWPNLEYLRPDQDEVKFVVANRGDWEFALSTIERYDLIRRTKAVLISPAWAEIDLKELADWVVGCGLEIRMQLQLHKYVWGPEVQGV